MGITNFEIGHRRMLFSLTAVDVQSLVNVKPAIEREIDSLVVRFYELQTSVPEIALLIGDADTLGRLRNAQRKYVMDLFSGFYDVEYVNSRLRIGLVHKRIGVEPKLYLSAIYTLKKLLIDLLQEILPDNSERLVTISALEKLFMFDIALVFETYLHSLISEIKEVSRTDPLTGLQNTRNLAEILTQILNAAQRRSEPVSLVYIDVNDLKIINDTQGHQRGDETLRIVAHAIKSISRKEDHCFRYGGDEFCTIIPNCTVEQAENAYGQRLLNEIHKHERNLTLSMGYAQTGPADYVSPEELIRQADERMYAVKSASKISKQPSGT
jgi:diguanylate cyclase (GGDEF)-like protein